MSTWRTRVFALVPTYMLPVLDLIGEFGDPAFMNGINMRRQTVMLAALLEYIDKVAADVPEVAKLQAEVKKKTRVHEKGTRQRKMAQIEKLERVRMLGRRVVDDFPPPRYWQERIKNKAEAERLVAEQAKRYDEFRGDRIYRDENDQRYTYLKKADAKRLKD